MADLLNRPVKRPSKPEKVPKPKILTDPTKRPSYPTIGDPLITLQPFVYLRSDKTHTPKLYVTPPHLYPRAPLGACTHSQKYSRPAPKEADRS